jgi:hypothetical protein
MVDAHTDHADIRPIFVFLVFFEHLLHLVEFVLAWAVPGCPEAQQQHLTLIVRHFVAAKQIFDDI